MLGGPACHRFHTNHTVTRCSLDNLVIKDYPRPSLCPGACVRWIVLSCNEDEGSAFYASFGDKMD
jgi:hypothetical protein